MKKTVLGFILIFGIMASLLSCGMTYKMVVDENVPAAQSATVTFENVSDKSRRVAYWSGIKVKEHNDRNIVDDLYGGSKNISGTILTVPAGNSRFLVDMTFKFARGRNTVYSLPVNNLEIRYDLEPGKKYLITGITTRTKYESGFLLVEWGEFDLSVGIYDVTEKKTLLREWKLGVFPR